MKLDTKITDNTANLFKEKIYDENISINEINRDITEYLHIHNKISYSLAQFYTAKIILKIVLDQHDIIN